MTLSRLAGLALAIIALVGLQADWGMAQQVSLSGDTGFRKAFELKADDYNVFLVVKPPLGSMYVDTPRHCSFGGMLERTSPTYDKFPLGTGVYLSSRDVLPFKIDQTYSLEAGQYQLYITPGTDCRWSVLVTPQGTKSEKAADSGKRDGSDLCCISAISINVGETNTDVGRSISLGQAVAVTVMVERDDGRLKGSHFGTYRLMHGTTPWDHPVGLLQFSCIGDDLACAYMVRFKWEDAAKYLGENTIEVYTSQGLAKRNFTLTK